MIDKMVSFFLNVLFCIRKKNSLYPLTYPLPLNWFILIWSRGNLEGGGLVTKRSIVILYHSLNLNKLWREKISTWILYKLNYYDVCLHGEKWFITCYEVQLKFILAKMHFKQLFCFVVGWIQFQYNRYIFYK